MEKNKKIDPAKLKEGAVRLEHLKIIKDKGINPFPSTANRTHTLEEAKKLVVGEVVSVVGRLMSQRQMGRLTFCHLKDSSGTLQIAINEKNLGKDKYKFFTKYYDVGDFVNIDGEIFITKKGEVSVMVKKYTLLSKALSALPEKWHGLTDIEQRFRKRYLDLIMNSEVTNRMLVRSKIISAIRNTLDKQDFVEVETPTLQPIYGGGFAKPFKTHHNALDAQFYLRISDEMYLKRLIIGGMEKVYEITKVFRNEGIDHDHNPEFTMFEAQIAYQDYNYGMDLIEELVEKSAMEVLGTTRVKHKDVVVDVTRPWTKMSLVDAVKKFVKIDMLKWEKESLAKKELSSYLISKKQKENLKILKSMGEIMAFAFEELVEEKLIQPTIIYDYPVEVSPLAKKCQDIRFTERFEVFALGSEISNNYSELNNPIELEKRFIEEKKKEQAGFDEAHQTDYDYLEAMKHGSPPICGIALGIDRVVMMLTGSENIKEVILFPTLKPESYQKEIGRSKKTMSVHAVILDTKNYPTWSKLNTASHLAASFAARLGKELIHIDSSTSKDGQKFLMNIQHAIMIKSSKSSEDLLELKEEAEKKDLIVSVFTEDMLASSNDLQVKSKHEAKNSNEIKLLGVLIYGEINKVENITKQFKLVK